MSASTKVALETAEGRDVPPRFQTMGCTLARFCVLQQPGLLKANMVGAWLIPEDATSTEGLMMVAQMFAPRRPTPPP